MDESEGESQTPYLIGTPAAPVSRAAPLIYKIYPSLIYRRCQRSFAKSSLKINFYKTTHHMR
ncbi:MAG: hypothetical protein ACOX7G_05480 [Candidatus Scatomorpha sp.]|jgi:hypothetical protein